MSRTTADIVNEIVRFTVQRAPGVSVAGDPTAMMQAWMEVANAWLGEETYRSNLDAWKAQHGRRVPSDARPYRMSFSQLVTTVITRAGRVTPADGSFLTTVARAFGDIGLDLRARPGHGRTRPAHGARCALAPGPVLPGLLSDGAASPAPASRWLHEPFVLGDLDFLDRGFSLTCW